MSALFNYSDTQGINIFGVKDKHVISTFSFWLSNNRSIDKYTVVTPFFVNPENGQ